MALLVQWGWGRRWTGEKLGSGYGWDSEGLGCSLQGTQKPPDVFKKQRCERCPRVGGSSGNPERALMRTQGNTTRGRRAGAQVSTTVRQGRSPSSGLPSGSRCEARGGGRCYHPVASVEGGEGPGHRERDTQGAWGGRWLPRAGSITTPTSDVAVPLCAGLTTALGHTGHH